MPDRLPLRLTLGVGGHAGTRWRSMRLTVPGSFTLLIPPVNRGNAKDII